MNRSENVELCLLFDKPISNGDNIIVTDGLQALRFASQKMIGRRPPLLQSVDSNQVQIILATRTINLKPGFKLTQSKNKSFVLFLQRCFTTSTFDFK
jgi:hypothetical protein